MTETYLSKNNWKRDNWMTLVTNEKKFIWTQTNLQKFSWETKNEDKKVESELTTAIQRLAYKFTWD